MVGIIIAIIIILVLIFIILVVLSATKERRLRGQDHSHYYPPRHHHAPKSWPVCNSECEVPCAPILECQAFIDGDVVQTCGQILGQPTEYAIAWSHSENKSHPVTGFRIYLRQGVSGPVEVGPGNYDQFFTASAKSRFFQTPPTFSCASIVVTAINECGESLPSEVFTYCPLL